MGLLDEAIREHLELKRSRGADPTEVARAEEDALGPLVRQQAETAAAAAPAADVPEPDPELQATPAQPAAETVQDLGAGEQPGDPAVPSAQPPPSEPDAVGDDPAAPQEAPDDQATVVFDAEGFFVDEPEPAGTAPPAPAEPREAAEPEPAPAEPAEPEPEPKFKPAEHPEGGAAAPDEAPPSESGTSEDVLEETPEFLQETPEHDRLWFEQKPPRDFDFDG